MQPLYYFETTSFYQFVTRYLTFVTSQHHYFKKVALLHLHQAVGLYIKTFIIHNTLYLTQKMAHMDRFELQSDSEQSLKCMV